MKKTRFFYEINYFLFVLLGWLLLLGKAVEVNREKDREMTEKRNKPVQVYDTDRVLNMKDSMQFKKLQRGDQTFFCRAYMYAG